MDWLGLVLATKVASELHRHEHACFVGGVMVTMLICTKCDCIPTFKCILDMN